MYIISVITTSPFHYRTHLFTHSLPPYYRQSMRSVYLYIRNRRGEWRMPTANWPQLFLSCDCFYHPSIYLISYIRASKHITLKEEAGSYESDIYTLVHLFDKAVAEGARPNTVNTRSEPLRRDIEIYPDSQPARYIYWAFSLTWPNLAGTDGSAMLVFHLRS